MLEEPEENLSDAARSGVRVDAEEQHEMAKSRAREKISSKQRDIRMSMATASFSDRDKTAEKGRIQKSKGETRSLLQRRLGGATDMPVGPAASASTKGRKGTEKTVG